MPFRSTAHPLLKALPALLAVALGAPVPGLAAWPGSPTVNVPLSTAAYEQDNPVVASDGAGGAIVVWKDRRGAGYDIYAQRIAADGTALWTPDGVAVCYADGEQTAPAVVSNGAGGAIIAWADPRNGCFDIYAQHVSAGGEVQWADNGVAVCSATDCQFNPVMVADGAGGAIITWWDKRASYYGSRDDIYAQRISSAGEPQWTTDGNPICNAVWYQERPAITTDGAGGAIIAWRDSRSNGVWWDVYIQKVSASGAPQWADSGLAVCTVTSEESDIAVVSDGAGGAFVAWTDTRTGANKTFAQKVSAGGSVVWTPDGVAACTGVGSEYDPVIIADGAGGAIITWTDYRFFGVSGGDIYGSKISAAGALQWPAHGVLVCNNIYGDQIYSQLISDGAGGAIVTWQDNRIGNYYEVDVYAQRILSTGGAQWMSAGVGIGTASGAQSAPVIAPAREGGAIIAWSDTRSGYSDIYAQRLQLNGLLGGTVSVPDGDTPLSFGLDPVRPNPVLGGRLTVRFTLPGDDAASLELFDLAGRRVAVQEIGRLGTGTHTLELGAGQRLAPGIYLVRLRQGANSRMTRVSVL